MRQHTAAIAHAFQGPTTKTHGGIRYYLRAFISGLLLSLGFAPFHLPGLAFLSLALLFLQLSSSTPKKGLIKGFWFGVGFLGLGTSWVYNSVHIYGNMNFFVSLLLTALFVSAYSLYFAIFGWLFTTLSHRLSKTIAPFIFGSLWFFIEYARATWLTGFPWLLVGFGQIDSPLKHLLPIFGVLGVSGITALLGGILGLAIQKDTPKRFVWLGLFVLCLLLPNTLASIHWTTTQSEPLSIRVIQANLAMRDKWDAQFYDRIQTYYSRAIEKALPKADLVILPESAIPMPSHYASEFLDPVHTKALAQKKGVLLGMPHPNREDNTRYHNALLALGDAHGAYLKRHLVPFGEYIPKPFLNITQRLGLPDPHMATGASQQAPIQFKQYRIAALICYELAYPHLIRTTLPASDLIVSLSDDGWFGHSFAMHQHLQMAQALSKQTGKYQVFANNNGRSALIDANGTLINSLPAFEQGTLKGRIYPASGQTPWANYGIQPAVILFGMLLLFGLVYRIMLAAKGKRRYPNQPSKIP